MGNTYVLQTLSRGYKGKWQDVKAWGTFVGAMQECNDHVLSVLLEKKSFKDVAIRIVCRKGRGGKEVDTAIIQVNLITFIRGRRLSAMLSGD